MNPSAPLSLSVRDLPSLAEANEALHDALFDTDDVTYDPAAGLFRLRSHRDLSGSAGVLAGGAADCAVEIHSVEEATIRRTDRTLNRGFTLTGIHYNAGIGLMRLEIMGPDGDNFDRLGPAP